MYVKVFSIKDKYCVRRKTVNNTEELENENKRTYEQSVLIRLTALRQQLESKQTPALENSFNLVKLF